LYASSLSCGIIPRLIIDLLHKEGTSMTLEQVFWASQCAAAVGVIASLIFVGLEVRNNAKAVRAATAQAVEQSIAAIYISLQANPSALASCTKGVVDYGALTPTEKAQFVCTLMAVLSLTENAFYQWRVGLLRADLWVGWESRMMNFMQTPGGAAFWRERSYAFSKDFQDAMKIAMSRPPHPLARTFGIIPVGHSAAAEGTPSPPV
jgi:hypothetical protein